MADDQHTASARQTLYDEDFYVWTQEQADAVRAAGAKGVLPAELDWERLAEEVGDLGKSELNKVLSLVSRIIEHLYLLQATQRVEPKAHWRKEVRAFRGDLERQFTPTIRKMTIEELDKLRRRAAKSIAAYLDDIEPGIPPPDASRQWTLPEILGDENDPLS